MLNFKLLEATVVTPDLHAHERLGVRHLLGPRVEARRQDKVAASASATRRESEPLVSYPIWGLH